MPVARVLSIVLALVLLSGCGTVTKRPDLDEEEIALEANRMREDVVAHERLMQRRLGNLATPLFIGNADLCGASTTHTIALGVHNIEDYRGKRRDIMASVYELDERIRVTAVGREGPAHIAGLREGDVILAVNEIETPRGMAATAFFKLHVRPLVESGKPMKFTLLRDAKKFTAIVQPVLSCNFPLRLQTTEEINAYATGTSITVYTGLVDSFQDDDVLGVVLAHELAHNVMGHIEKKTLRLMGDQLLGSFMQSLTGVGRSNGVRTEFAYLESDRDEEFEADYVALYFAARAGLGYERAPDFFRKLALNSPGAISRQTTHPKLPARFVAQEATIAEIRKKIALGQPLIPEFKTDQDQKKPSMKDGFAPVAVGLGMGQ